MNNQKKGGNEVDGQKDETRSRDFRDNSGNARSMSTLGRFKGHHVRRCDLATNGSIWTPTTKSGQARILSFCPCDNPPCRLRKKPASGILFSLFGRTNASGPSVPRITFINASAEPSEKLAIVLNDSDIHPSK